MGELPSFAVCIPTLNAGPEFERCLSLTRGALHGARLLVVDSSSSDGTAARARAAGAEVLAIARSDFNHGGTRSLAVRHLDTAEVVVFLTQDALPCRHDSFLRLVSHFADSKVGGAFGRQLPHDDATPIAAHARLFNYPETSRITSAEDV